MIILSVLVNIAPVAFDVQAQGGVFPISLLCGGSPRKGHLSEFKYRD